MRGRGQDVVEELLTTVDYLRIMVGTVSDGREWLVSSDLIADPPWLLSIVWSTAAGWDTDDDTVAMSLFIQGYVYRIASTAIGSFVLSVHPENTAIALGGHRPNAPTGQRGVGGGRQGLGRAIPSADRRMPGPFVEAVHGSMQIGKALLWSNVGSSCAASFGAFVGPLAHDTERIRDLAEGFFATGRGELVG